MAAVYIQRLVQFF